MKRRLTGIRLAALLPLAALALVALRPAAAGAGLFGGALGAYENHEFDEAITKCKGEKSLECKLVTAFSYLEKYQLYKNKGDKEQAKAYLSILEVDVGPKDVGTIEKVLNVAGNPNGNKEAAKLLKRAFANAKTTPGDVMTIVEFLHPAKGLEANGIALDALIDRLKPVREYVSKGGTMPAEMRKLFADKDVIEPVIGLLGEKKLAGDAAQLCEIIEEPTLRYLEEMEITKGVSNAIVKVKKAIAKRVKKYSESTWYGASGE